jgi:hypothetical protein
LPHPFPVRLSFRFVSFIPLPSTHWMHPLTCTSRALALGSGLNSSLSPFPIRSVCWLAYAIMADPREALYKHIGLLSPALALDHRSPNTHSAKRLSTPRQPVVLITQSGGEEWRRNIWVFMLDRYVRLNDSSVQPAHILAVANACADPTRPTRSMHSSLEFPFTHDSPAKDSQTTLRAGERSLHLFDLTPTRNPIAQVITPFISSPPHLTGLTLTSTSTARSSR